MCELSSSKGTDGKKGGGNPSRHEDPCSFSASQNHLLPPLSPPPPLNQLPQVQAQSPTLAGLHRNYPPEGPLEVRNKSFKLCSPRDPETLLLEQNN